MLRRRYNGELANGIGNLLARTVTMIGRYFDGATPAPARAADREGAEVRAAAEALAAATPGAMAACRFQVVLDGIGELTGATNRFIDATEPFKLAKVESAAAKERLADILYTCAEAVRIALLYLRPFMPDSADRGLAQLGWSVPAKPLCELGRWGLLQPGSKLQPAEALFPRKS
jgi:methionyl-tRNA synthetase